MFPQKLCLFGELQRFRRHSDLRAEISHIMALKSRKKDETQPSYELLSGKTSKTHLNRRATAFSSFPRVARRNFAFNSIEIIEKG